MPAFTHSLRLPTRYGEATYTLAADTNGSVTLIASPLAGMPAAVYQLTYGKRWRDVRTHFDQLGETLVYRVAAVLHSNRAPAHLTSLAEAYRSRFPEATATAYGEFWSRHPKQMKLFALEERTLNGALDALRQRGQQRDISDFNPHLLPYLRSLLPLASHATTVAVYSLIGQLGSKEAGEYLLGQLEAEGRHPYTAQLLRALEKYTDNATLQRLILIGEQAEFDREELSRYLRGMDRFATAPAADHLFSLIGRFPDAAEDIAASLQALGIPRGEIAAALRAQFDREVDYRPLWELLAAVNGLAVAAYAIDLVTLNEKLAAVRYTDLPPVNWRQLLEEEWRELVSLADHKTALRVIETYLLRPEPKLQRNAVLQLRAYLGREDAVRKLPIAVEERLVELLSSRIDKIFVEVMNVLAEGKLRLHDPDRMLHGLLGVSVGSRYRIVVLHALLAVGDTERARSAALTYYRTQIGETTDAGRLEELTSLLPFLAKYLGDVTSLTEALTDRATPH